MRRFLESKLPTLNIVISLLTGAAALLFTPREEAPQITMPMVDILVRFPGASPREVENLVIIPVIYYLLAARPETHQTRA